MTDIAPSARRRDSVSRRLLVVTLLVAVIAVLVTAVAAVGFARSVDTTAARNALQAQAERLANAESAVRAGLIRSLSGIEGELVALVPPEGAPTGSAAPFVPRRVIVQLREGIDVSTVVRVGGQSYLVEGHASADGGGVVVAQTAASVRSLTPAVVGRISLALLVGIGVAAAAALVVARRLSRPLTELSRRARRLAGGERGIDAAPSGVTEIDQVDAALTSLDKSLARSEARQREFLLSISHEIRTPLTALRGYAEALADGTVRADELTTIGGTLAIETARLTRFTDDLLALARLDADDFSLDFADGVSVSQVARAVADAWGARAAAVGITLAVVEHTTVPTVRTDPHRLRQVIDGLIENALRVSPTDSSITISLNTVPGAAVIEVADEGPGITEDDAAVAFDRAVLRDRYRDARPVGSGLGLSIAARLVYRLGGRIIAAPRTPGTVFRVEIPNDSLSAA
ncbi:MAG: HAMP domain-containing histidine kinase [Microbacteriaceae bacterium]|nr:HAMP domain-containing histidine kinase [Microbacteriaceae bacterium]